MGETIHKGEHSKIGWGGERIVMCRRGKGRGSTGCSKEISEPA